jgi:hypothetical protein
MNSKLKALNSQLNRWGLRLRLVESLIWAPWGAVAGLGAGLLLAIGAQITPLLTARTLIILTCMLTLVGVVVGLAVVWLRPRPYTRLARTFDRRFGLAERLTTAVEIGSGQLLTAPAMAVAQLADTLAAAGGADARVMLPLRTSRRALVVFGVLVAALALSLWLPNPQQDVLLRQAAARAAIEEQVEELETAREEIAQAEGLTEAEREMLLRALEEAMAALDGGRATPEEAVAALSGAEQALAKLQDPAAATVQAGLDRAAEGMADSELTRDVAEALAQGNYWAAAEALAAYAGTEGEPLTREEELELARELAGAAEILAESDPDLAEQLAQAAEAIERGDMVQARKEIQEAAQQMAASGQRVQRQETVEGTLAELQEGREQIAQASAT